MSTAVRAGRRRPTDDVSFVQLGHDPDPKSRVSLVSFWPSLRTLNKFVCGNVGAFPPRF